MTGFKKRSPARVGAQNWAANVVTSHTKTITHRHPQQIDFANVNAAALAALPAILSRLLPGGKIDGREFVALNPRRKDTRLGSFKINMRSGRWSDFATGHRGGDPVSLVAYLENVSQSEAARLLARMLGLELTGARHG
jgi:hypothetical protein